MGEMLAYASAGERLAPGDVISTGTMPGCCGLELDRWIEPIALARVTEHPEVVFLRRFSRAKRRGCAVNDTLGTASQVGLRPRKAPQESMPALSETLALAFYDDPVVTWVMADGSRRREILPEFFGAVAQSYSSHDEIWDVEEGVSAAIWAPPGAEDDEALGEQIGAIASEYAERAFEVMGLMEEKHPVEPHYYLFFLGTRPEWQGRGVGSALMRPVLETCDRDGVPAYLEATSERNRQLYLRHGFEVTDEIQLPDGPTLWCMWRTPQ